MKSKYIGSSFDDFLKEEGSYEEAIGHFFVRITVDLVYGSQPLVPALNRALT